MGQLNCFCLIGLWAVMDSIESPKWLIEVQKLVRLNIGHLIGPNVVAWYDFCHTKNLKFVPPPIIRCVLIMGRNGKILNGGPKIVPLHMGHLIGPKIAAWYDFAILKI